MAAQRAARKDHIPPPPVAPSPDREDPFVVKMPVHLVKSQECSWPQPSSSSSLPLLFIIQLHCSISSVAEKPKPPPPAELPRSLLQSHVQHQPFPSVKNPKDLPTLQGNGSPTSPGAGGKTVTTTTKDDLSISPLDPPHHRESNTSYAAAAKSRHSQPPLQTPSQSRSQPQVGLAKSSSSIQQAQLPAYDRRLPADPQPHTPTFDATAPEFYPQQSRPYMHQTQNGQGHDHNQNHAPTHHEYGYHHQREAVSVPLVISGSASDSTSATQNGSIPARVPRETMMFGSITVDVGPSGGAGITETGEGKVSTAGRGKEKEAGEEKEKKRSHAGALALAIGVDPREDGPVRIGTRGLQKKPSGVGIGLGSCMAAVGIGGLPSSSFVKDIENIKDAENLNEKQKEKGKEKAKGKESDKLAAVAVPLEVKWKFGTADLPVTLASPADVDAEKETGEERDVEKQGPVEKQESPPSSDAATAATQVELNVEGEVSSVDRGDLLVHPHPQIPHSYIKSQHFHQHVSSSSPSSIPASISLPTSSSTSTTSSMPTTSILPSSTSLSMSTPVSDTILLASTDPEFEVKNFGFGFGNARLRHWQDDGEKQDANVEDPSSEEIEGHDLDGQDAHKGSYAYPHPSSIKYATSGGENPPSPPVHHPQPYSYHYHYNYNYHHAPNHSYLHAHGGRGRRGFVNGRGGYVGERDREWDRDRGNAYGPGHGYGPNGRRGRGMNGFSRGSARGGFGGQNHHYGYDQRQGHHRGAMNDRGGGGVGINGSGHEGVGNDASSLYTVTSPPSFQPLQLPLVNEASTGSPSMGIGRGNAVPSLPPPYFHHQLHPHQSYPQQHPGSGLGPGMGGQGLGSRRPYLPLGYESFASPMIPGLPPPPPTPLSLAYGGYSHRGHVYGPGHEHVENAGEHREHDQRHDHEQGQEGALTTSAPEHAGTITGTSIGKSHLLPPAPVPVPVPLSTIAFPLDATRYYLLGQLEYYLSPQNMVQDFYLRQQVGFISFFLGPLHL